MPHVDLQAEMGASFLDCDVCIVGTGPAGCTIARELSNTSLRVTIVESGNFDRQEHVDALNTIENVGRSRVLDQWRVRNRVVGGSSHTWGGRCAPFDAIDFERRDWIPHSGWPFGLDHLNGYLERTMEYLGLNFGTGFNDERFWKLAGRTPPRTAEDPQYLLPFFWQASRDDEARRDSMRFGRHLLRSLGHNVTLVTNATAVHLNTTETGCAIASIDVASPQGARRRIAASSVVLCAGAIENARLLLSSNTRVEAGVGNQNDLVGRFLMDHPRDTVGFFPGMSRQLQKRFGSYRIRKKSGQNLFRRGFRLNPHVQRTEGLVNCSAFLRDVAAPDDPWTALIQLLNGPSHARSNWFKIASHPGLFLRASYNYFVARRPMPHKLERLELVCMCEQVPDPESRITLSANRDRFGMRLSRIDWKSHEVEARTIRRMAELVSQQFARLKEEVPVLDAWIRRNESFPPGTFLDVAHPMGTTRMSTSPRTGVVNGNCEVHGVRGLFLSGSSVFPTSGHCNPTQMIVALAIRLADFLKVHVETLRAPLAVE